MKCLRINTPREWARRPVCLASPIASDMLASMASSRIKLARLASGRIKLARRECGMHLASIAGLHPGPAMLGRIELARM